MATLPTEFTTGTGRAVGAKVKQLEVEIPAGTNADSLQAIHMAGYSLLEIITPSSGLGGWVTSNINVLASQNETDPDNPTGNYVTLNDSNGVRTAIVNCLANQAYVFVNDKGTTIAASKWLKLRSVTSQLTTQIVKITLKG